MSNSRKSAGKKPLIFIGAAGLCAVIAGAFAFGETRPAADKINDSSLIIGTYLIDFEALNEENQALAEKNAQDTSQFKVYYKSELNEGVWYDITDAESVSDITLTNSRIVDNAVIDKLELTLYFKADGSVVDFSTGEEVSKQEINGMFYPAEMSELSAVLKQQDIVKTLAENTDDDDADDETKAKHKLHVKEVEELDKLFLPISDSTCSGLIKDMDSLDAVIGSSEGSAKDAATAVKVKKRAELDNYCRGVVCDRIDEIVTELTNHDNAAHAELIALLTSAESEIKGNMSDTQSEIGAEPTDTVGRKQQELQDALLEAAKSGDSAAAEKAAQTLSVLEAMINGDSTDGAAAAELSGEMLDDAMSSIGDEISAILNGTHDYYKEGGLGMSAQEVLAQIQTEIADAEQLAKDKAFYTTGSTTSDEYNKQLSGDLSTLGLMLSAMAESGGGSDDLSRQVIAAAADSADSVLSAAAKAEASAKPATDEQKQINDLESRLDTAYGKYLDALNSGNDSGAESALALVDSLREQLDGLRDDVAAQVGDLVKELFGEMNSTDHDKDKLRELNAQLSVDKGYLSDVDRALLEQALAAVEDMQAAVESGSVSKSETAYDSLSGALQNVPGDLLDDSVKADILSYMASLLAEDSSSDGATDTGGFAGLLDDIMKDISAANRGEFTPDDGDIEDMGESGDIGGTGGIDTEDSIIAALYEYKLVIPSLNIYSNTMSIEKSGTVFIDMQALAREAGLKRFVSGEVYVFRGDDILVELTPDSSTAYVGDKLYAPSAEPYFSGDVLYVSADLVAAGLKLVAETENGTTFIR